MGFDCNDYTTTCTDGWKEPQKPKHKSAIKYYIFCVRWIWKNREWENGRHKRKMMDRDYRRYLIAKQMAK